MCLVYARSGTSYSMYTFMSRWLPKTLCHNVCGISSEPVTAVAVYSQHSVPALIWHLLWTFLLLWQRTERSNIHWTSGLCCETFMFELYWLQRVPWLCNVIVRDFLHCMKWTPYERARMSWNLRTVQSKKSRIWRNSYCWELPNAYTLVSRWLPNTLCYHVCGFFLNLFRRLPFILLY